MPIGVVVASTFVGDTCVKWSRGLVPQAEPQYVQIFRSGPGAWNAWRENRPDIVPHLAGISPTLSERQMGPIHGGPINLKSTLLQGACLRFATLSLADLEAADLSEADLAYARLDGADLTDAHMVDALLDHADFSGATLTRSNLCGASLHYANFSTADLQAADMSDADLAHAHLDRANLRGANLTNARLDYADFSQADLSRVNLAGASLEYARNLTESQLRESTTDAATILPPHMRKTPLAVDGDESKIDHQIFRRRSKLAADAYAPYVNSRRLVVLFVCLALVTTAIVWLRVQANRSLDGQKWLDSVVAQLRPSNNSERGLQPTMPTAAEDTNRQARQVAVPAEPPVIPNQRAATPGGLPMLAQRHPPLEELDETSASSMPNAIAQALGELQPMEQAEPPVEVTALSVPEQSLRTPSPSYTLSPVVTDLPVVSATEFADQAEVIPLPIRKPLIRKPTRKLDDTLPKGPSIARPDQDFASSARRPKGPSRIDSKPQPTGRSFSDDLLAGGL